MDRTGHTLEELYQEAFTLGFDKRRVDRLVDHFEIAVKFLVHKIDTEGWMWRDNYLREHVGCAFRTGFTNTVSPIILELLFRRYPQWRKYRHTNQRTLL